jgi:cytochrome c553
VVNDDPLYTGRIGNRLVTTYPIPITRAVLERGQERFNVYCSPCHSRIGDGTGMIVKRGFPPPPDYAIRRLRDAPVGHFFDVMTNGYGAMYSYASRVQPEDRWAIAAYIRVLQAARNEVPPETGQSARERARKLGIGTLPAPPVPGTEGVPGSEGTPGAGMPAGPAPSSGVTPRPGPEAPGIMPSPAAPPNVPGSGAGSRPAPAPPGKER